MSCEPYNANTSPINLHDLCYRLLQFDGMWGIYILNNEDVIGILDGMVALLRGSDFMQPTERWSFKPRPKAGRRWKPAMQVGWLKTVPPVRDLPLLPFQLQVDKTGMANLDNVRTLALPDAVECADPKLYKELIARDADIVYMTNSGPVFKKGVL